MKRIVILTIISTLLLSGCSAKGLTPLKVNYEVGSLKDYNEAVASSTVTRSLSDFQLIEMEITEVPYCNLYDYVITQGSEVISYSKVINTKSLNDLVTISCENTEELYDTIAAGKNVVLEENGYVIPTLEPLVKQANSVSMHDVFVKSILKELGV